MSEGCKNRIVDSADASDSDTRLAKLDAPDSPFACIILATAGLVRLGLGRRITQRLTPDVFPYAVGQGALGIEVAEGDDEAADLARRVESVRSRWRCLAERAMLRRLQGGCSSPVGVWTELELMSEADRHLSLARWKLKLGARVLNVEGTAEVTAEGWVPMESDKDAVGLGEIVAESLLQKGARDLLEGRQQS